MSNPRMTKATTTRSAARFATRSIVTPNDRQRTAIFTDGKQLEIKNNKGQKANYDEVLHNMVPAFLKKAISITFKQAFLECNTFGDGLCLISTPYFPLARDIP